ncbi:MAG: transposase [Lentisphaeraceae bacterium]|nr:transposase [Lentisphaeraceae bacterium]
MNERYEFDNPQNWHSRGYLFHYDAAGKYQMITYRLSDSLPQGKIQGTRASDSQSDAQKRKEVEQFLDRGYGSCILKMPQIAQLLVDAWTFFDGERYDLVAYVVMPNHVHVLVRAYEAFPLKSVVHSWKSFTAHEIKKFLNSLTVLSSSASLLC